MRAWAWVAIRRLVLMPLLLGCAHRPGSAGKAAPPIADAAPPAIPDDVRGLAPDAVAACAGHFLDLREEFCGELAPGEACELQPLPCAHRVDLDGDGEPDLVELAPLGTDDVGLRVTFGDGRRAPIDRPIPTQELGTSAPEGEEGPSFAWLVAWRPALVGDHGLHVDGRNFDIAGARGDGIWMSGGDAAAILVLTDAGWLLVPLGY